MYNLHKVLTMLMLVLSPVRAVAALPITLPAETQAPAISDTVPYNLTLTTQSPAVVTVEEQPQADIEAEVLVPLRAAQAEAEAKAKAEAAARAEASQKAKVAASTPAVATDDAWYKLRLCESGNDYTKNTGNGYFGAYQYNLSTWNNHGGFARPDLAPADVQDAKAHADYERRGWSPWPACSKRLQ